MPEDWSVFNLYMQFKLEHTDVNNDSVIPSRRITTFILLCDEVYCATGFCYFTDTSLNS